MCCCALWKLCSLKMSDFYTPQNGFPNPVQIQFYQFCLESWRIYCWIDQLHPQIAEDQKWKYLREAERPSRRRSWQWRQRLSYRGRLGEIHKSLCWRSMAAPALGTMMMMRCLEWFYWKQRRMKNIIMATWAHIYPSAKLQVFPPKALPIFNKWLELIIIICFHAQ